MTFDGIAPIYLFLHMSTTMIQTHEDCPLSSRTRTTTSTSMRTRTRTMYYMESHKDEDSMRMQNFFTRSSRTFEYIMAWCYLLKTMSSGIQEVCQLSGVFIAGNSSMFSVHNLWKYSLVTIGWYHEEI